MVFARIRWGCNSVTHPGTSSSSEPLFRAARVWKQVTRATTRQAVWTLMTEVPVCHTDALRRQGARATFSSRQVPCAASVSVWSRARTRWRRKIQGAGHKCRRPRQHDEGLRSGAAARLRAEDEKLGGGSGDSHTLPGLEDWVCGAFQITYKLPLGYMQVTQVKKGPSLGDAVNTGREQGVDGL